MAKKIRIIMNGVSFFTSKKQIVDGVGDNVRVNAICLYAYNKCIDEKVLGFGYTFTGTNPDTKYSIQINL